MSFSNELITVLDYLAQKLGIAVDWTSDNVMPYLKDLCDRFIEYEIFNSFMSTKNYVIILIEIINKLDSKIDSLKSAIESNLLENIREYYKNL